MVSGQVSVSASLDSATIVMGQQAIVHFSVTQPQNKAVQMPVFSDQLADGLQIVEIKGDTVVTGNNITINQDIIVTSFSQEVIKYLHSCVKTDRGLSDQSVKFGGKRR